MDEGAAPHHSFLRCQMQRQPVRTEDAGFAGNWLRLCKQSMPSAPPNKERICGNVSSHVAIVPSQTEIQLVQSLGVDPSRIIYANPCKQVSQIKYAAAHGVQMMTFDSEVELLKVARCHDNAK